MFPQLHVGIQGLVAQKCAYPIQSKEGGGFPPPKGFFIITFEQFRIQSSNYTNFPKIL